MRSWKLLSLVLAVAPARGVAQTSPPSCSAAEHRQFDFWLGSWAVFNPQGEQVGINTISSELNGCVLHEHWESLRGAHRGNSYNIYHRVSGRWHQTWVDNAGLLLLLEGGLREGAMILEGRSRRADGVEQLERITWSPAPDGSVRQLWEQSTDGGSTWTVVFEGHYRRRR